MRASFAYLVTVFLRRLWLPLALFAGFNVMGVAVYRRLEGLRWQDAFFWDHASSCDGVPAHP